MVWAANSSGGKDMSTTTIQLIADVVLVLGRQRSRYENPRKPGHITKNQHARIAKDFADALADTNVNFDRARFLSACGVS